MFATIFLSAAILASTITALPTNTSSSNSSSSTPSNNVVNTLANNLTAIYDLELAPTAAIRLNMITQPYDWVYDFNNPPSNAVVQGKGGHTVRSDRLVFPPTIGNGVSMTVGFLGPCGFNTPHVHPRSAQINIVVQGRLGTEFTAENGVSTVFNELNTLQMTIFPQGAVHTEFNPDCTDAMFVAAFASEDPGVQQSAQTFFGLNEDIVSAALGTDTINGQDIDQFKSQIPANVALGVESCLAKCNIKKRKA